MDRLPYENARSWQSRLSPFWIRVIRRGRIWRQRRHEGLWRVTVEGLEHLRSAVERGHGILITPNHAGHADAFILLAASDELKRPFCYMVAWQVLQLFSPLGRWVLQRHGCFSVDREGHDLRAFRTAVDIVANSPNPLVVFPEGEVYHNCDWLAPFRQGPAAIALAAARRARRPVVCVPAAIRYQYIEDPTPRLNRLMEALERRILWRPRPELPLAQRLRSFAEALLTLREQFYLGHTQSGGYAQRIDALMAAILDKVEKYRPLQSSQREGPASAGDVPGRVSQLRHQVITEMGRLPRRDPRRLAAQAQLDDLSLVVQLFSYREDFANERPSTERLAELIDKFEEDVLEAPTATIHGKRRATIRFGKPVPVPKERGDREQIRRLTETLEQEVRALLTQLKQAPEQPSEPLRNSPETFLRRRQSEEGLQSRLG